MTPRPFPSIAQAVWLLLLIVALQLLAGIVLGAFVALTGAGYDGALGASLGNLLAFGAALWLAALLSGRPPRELFPLRPVPGRVWAAVSVTTVGWQFLGSEIDNALRIAFPPPEWVVGLMSQLSGGSLSSLALLILVAPVTEELFFRGALLQGFIRRYSFRTAVASSAVLFALIHINPWQFPAGLILGALFAWWTLRTGSLGPALAMHALHNGLAPLLLRGLGLRIPGYSMDMSAEGFQPLWLDALGAAAFAAGIWMTWRLLPGHRNETEPKGQPVITDAGGVTS